MSIVRLLSLAGIAAIAFFAWLLIAPRYGMPVKPVRVYIGTYTGDMKKGIHTAVLDLANGRLSRLELAAATPSPNFLAIDPTRNVLFAANAYAFEGPEADLVTAFAIEAGTGRLTELNAQRSGGLAPCHICLDEGASQVLVANFSGGSVAVLPIDPTGALGPATSVIKHGGSGLHPKRQAGPHPHGVAVDPQNRYAFVADFGVDKVFVYKFDAQAGVLVPNDPPFVAVTPGSGPRQFAFHPSGRVAYLLNEMACTLVCFGYDPQDGVLTSIQTIGTLPAGARESAGAGIAIHPGGGFLYASNRGDDSIALFSIDQQSGMLVAKGHYSSGGKRPRHIAIDPSGACLVVANQRSGTVTAFLIDPSTGALTHTSTLAITSPACVTFLPGWQ